MEAPGSPANGRVLILFGSQPGDDPDWQDLGKRHRLPPYAINFSVTFKLDTELVWDRPPESDISSVERANTDRLIQFIRALWALMLEPYIEQTDVEPDRQASKRHQRATGKSAPTIRIITLRRKAADATKHLTEASGRHLHHQFVVNGHWRRQPYGPGRTLRRLRWIAPFVKGPEDGEWLHGEKLYRLER